MSNFYNEEFIDIDGNKIHKTVVIADNVKLGKGNIILPYTVIGYPGAIREMEKYQGKIQIGDNNFIGAHVTIMGGRDVTSIGDANIIMNKVNIGHDCSIFNRNEIGAGTVIAGHVTILNDNQIKNGCIIKNRIKIGNNIKLGSGSNLVRDIKSDNELWYGSPARKIGTED